MKTGHLLLLFMFLVGVLLLESRGVWAGTDSGLESAKTATRAVTTSTVILPARSTPPQPVATSNTARKNGEVADAYGPKVDPAVKAPPSADTTPEQHDISAMEKAFSQGVKGADTSVPQPYRTQMLTQFGYSFFRPSAGGFAPMTDIPVGPDYVIGPGDRIIINLWGSAEGTHDLEVNRSGEIFLPKVGSIKVWGITFDRLPTVIKTSLAHLYRDFELNVTMGKLRTIKVYVVGEVMAPGDYTISSLSTLINALSAAGGPLKTGTLRNIQVKRGGRVVETIDLYDFFLNGDKSRDIRLQPGDTIFVPVIARVAGISGNVKRPAIYELKNEKNLDDLVKLSEGLLPTGYLQRMQISRVVAHEKNVVADFNIDAKEVGTSLEQKTKSIPIQDMDLVMIFPIDVTLRDHVRLDGYVLRPGDYALQPGMRLSHLLLKDNLLPEFYKEAAEITRLYSPDYHPEKLFVNIAKALEGDSGHDLELKEFDKVRIFSRWEMEEMPMVKVNGEVQRPGDYRLFTNMTVRDLLLLAGNPKITAYLKNAEINRIKQSGESVTSFPIVINLEEAIKGNPKDNLTLAAFDELTIRKIPNWSEEKERYVTLKGEFRFPGVYPIYKGEKLSTLIERAGGFTDKAYLRAAKFTRESIRELQQKRMDEFVAKTELEIIKKQAEISSVASSKEELEATKAALESLQRSISILKTAKAEGRLVIAMDTIRFKGSRYDVELMGGDLLEVNQMPNAVNVLGQVYNPTSFIPVDDDDVAFYLAKAGGPARGAEESDIYIVRADGTVLSRQQVSLFKNLIFSGFMSTTLEPGDTIIVPQKYDKIAWMREIKDTAIIIGNLALAAGVLIATGI